MVTLAEFLIVGPNGKFKVWIVGSSIIRDAFQRAFHRPDGVHLGIERLGGSILWDFKPGMRIEHIMDTITHLLTYNPPPGILVIHCGGNNVGQTQLHTINLTCKDLMNKLLIKLPRTLFVWSAILPRREWRGEVAHAHLEKCRLRINSCIGALLIKKGCAYIRYPEIMESNVGFYKDSVHLSPLGYDIMLNTLQGGLYKFITSGSVIFPSSDEIGPWLSLENCPHGVC